MSESNLINSKLNIVSGGSNDEDAEKFYNKCIECGKKWDMREYGYGKETMPDWVTGPWCPDCRKNKIENNKNGSNNKNSCNTNYR